VLTRWGRGAFIDSQVAECRYYKYGGTRWCRTHAERRANQTRAGERSFAYDQANRLIQTTLAAETTSYGYDGDGKRLRAGATSFLWDTAHGLPELALERDPSGATIRRYAYGTELLSMRAAGEERYFHTDALGSVLNTSSSTGKLEWSYGYEPYGALRRQLRHGSNTADNPVRFTGAYQDNSGLYHLRARQYDAATGRFTATDPLAPLLTDPHVSSYIYANNLPTAFVDPSGMGAVRAGETVPKKKRYGNGCGPGDWREGLVPDGFASGFDFGDACERHDRCYGQWNRVRQNCDSRLLHDIRDECSDISWNPIQTVYTPHCFAAADLYYHGVRKGGKPSFREAQLAVCPFRSSNGLLLLSKCRASIRRRE